MVSNSNQRRQQFHERMRQRNQQRALQILFLSACLACLNVHTVDAISNIERWQNLRRDARGSLLILFWGVCSFFHHYDGGPIPANLQGISIRSIIVDNVLVQQIKGWLILAKAILPEESQKKYKSNSLGSVLMCQMNHGGTIHNKLSDAFGDIPNKVLKGIYNSNTSIIAVHDPRFPDVSHFNRTNILALRSARSDAANIAYQKIWVPGFFVNGGTEKLSLNKLWGIVGGAKTRINAFCAGLRDEFNAQATNNRVEERFVANGTGYLVSYGLQSP